MDREVLRPVRITTHAMEILEGYAWPGNVRELENIVSRAILKASAGYVSGEQVIIRPAHLGGDFSNEVSHTHPVFQPSLPKIATGYSLREATKNFQRQLIAFALDKNSGNWAAAARELGTNRSNLHNLATRLNLRKKAPH